MKLKKIASLALAGIMAVSMLAGCKDGGNSSSSSSENTNTNTGYSAMLGEKAADALYKAERDKIFTFADNNDDQKALADIALGISDTQLEKWVKGNSFGVTDVANIQADFRDKAKLDNTAKLTTYTNGFIGSDGANTVKIGEVWVANNTYSMDKVLDEIFETYKDAFCKTKKEGTDTKTNIEYNYDYTVSVSVVNKPATSNTQFNGSVNFVAVTITRTSTVA